MNEDLKRAFGNPGWTAGDLYREVMLDIASRSARTLELGSGLTTLDLARAGTKGIALEHLPHWVGYVMGVGAAMEIDLSTGFPVQYAPLKDYGPFEWYSYDGLDSEGRPEKYDFVVCDGPPQSTTGSRVGLIEAMGENLAAGCLILYDDYGSAPLDTEAPFLSVPDWWVEHNGVEVVEVYTPALMDGKPFALLKLP